jgi:hypothetical protein
MNVTNYDWTGTYNVRAIYKYKQEVEANLTIEFIQQGTVIKGKSLLKKQSIWTEDLFGILEGKLDNELSKTIKLNLKWYDSNNSFKNQSDLTLTINNTYSSFEGIIKNMMYTGVYSGQRRIEVNKSIICHEDKPIRRRISLKDKEQINKSDAQVNNDTINVNTTQNTTNNIDNSNNLIKKQRSRSVVNDQILENTINLDKKCIICCDNDKQSVFVPCGHKCCCEPCAKKFINRIKCPYCKKSVESIIAKVFE